MRLCFSSRIPFFASEPGANRPLGEMVHTLLQSGPLAGDHYIKSVAFYRIKGSAGAGLYEKTVMPNDDPDQ